MHIRDTENFVNEDQFPDVSLLPRNWEAGFDDLPTMYAFLCFKTLLIYQFTVLSFGTLD